MTSGWTEEEDKRLRQLVDEHGVKKWAFIATLMVSKGSKPCRRRWKNYLSADPKKGDWTLEEDATLLQGHSRYGNKWTEIAKMVGGRTDNAVKNRWSALVKKSSTASGPSPHVPAASSQRRRRGRESDDSDDVVAMTDTDYDSDEEQPPAMKKECLELTPPPLPQQRQAADDVTGARSCRLGGEGGGAEPSVASPPWATSSAFIMHRRESLHTRQAHWAPLAEHQQQHATPLMQQQQQQQEAQHSMRSEGSPGRDEPAPCLHAMLARSGVHKPPQELNREPSTRLSELDSKPMQWVSNASAVDNSDSRSAGHCHQLKPQRAQQRQQQEQQHLLQHQSPQQEQRSPEQARHHQQEQQQRTGAQAQEHCEAQQQQQQHEHLHPGQIEAQLLQLEQLQRMQEQQHRDQQQHLQQQQAREAQHLRELMDMQLQLYQRAMQEQAGALGEAAGSSAGVKAAAALGNAQLPLLPVFSRMVPDAGVALAGATASGRVSASSGITPHQPLPDAFPRQAACVAAAPQCEQLHGVAAMVNGQQGHILLHRADMSSLLGRMDREAISVRAAGGAVDQGWGSLQANNRAAPRRLLDTGGDAAGSHVHLTGTSNVRR